MISDAQNSVWHFMCQMNALAEERGVTTRQAIGKTPTIRDADLRAALIMEEARETAEALTGYVWEVRSHLLARVRGVTDALEGFRLARVRGPDIVEVADGLADVLVVSLGTAVACGIDLSPVFAAVMRANLAKLTEGARFRVDGKLEKPPDWKPPDIAAVLRTQGWEG